MALLVNGDKIINKGRLRHKTLILRLPVALSQVVWLRNDPKKGADTSKNTINTSKININIPQHDTDCNFETQEKDPAALTCIHPNTIKRIDNNNAT